MGSRGACLGTSGGGARETGSVRWDGFGGRYGVGEVSILNSKWMFQSFFFRGDLVYMAKMSLLVSGLKMS